MFRHWLFRNHGLVSLLLVTASTWAAICLFKSRNPLEIIAPIITIALGFSYFVQQQKLAEAQLFKELFTEFNNRYDKLNEYLADIASLPDGTSLESVDKKKIIDYFNLCSEEYLFYKDGYIHRDVWRSWCRGMKFYLDKKNIRDLWNKENELQPGSYYGLTPEEIEKGAKTKPTK